MKYFIIAGEASGDLHGSHLMQSLAAEDNHARFQHWGGDLMKAVDENQTNHISNLAIMGFWEVIKNLNTINGFFKQCKRQIESFEPDALILIDYPGFNLRMAKWAKEKGIPVFYYISPQLWAWKAKRIEKIKKYVTRLFVILPFEKDYYNDRQVDVSYYGHPLLHHIQQFRSHNPVNERSAYALFPGSRRQEITRVLPLMIAGAQKTSIERFYISRAPAIPTSFYNDLIADDQRFKLFDGSSYELFSQCKAAMVTSGTATLECALFDVPQIVCYSGSRISYAIARRLVKIDFIALANLIMNKEIVKELIQDDCNPENIYLHFSKLLEPTHRTNILNGYAELKTKLQTTERSTVPDLIATEILKRIQ